jgi:hypothetical protein
MFFMLLVGLVGMVAASVALLSYYADYTLKEQELEARKNHPGAEDALLSLTERSRHRDGSGPHPKHRHQA